MTKTSQTIARHYKSLQTADELLAERAHRDPSAYAELYDRYLNPVYRYFFLRLGNRPEAEDLTSQVFLAALKSLPGYRQGSSFAPGCSASPAASWPIITACAGRRSRWSRWGTYPRCTSPPWRAWRAANNCAA